MPNGVAIMSGGVASMRGSVSIAAAGSTGCCCGVVPCRCEAVPGCTSIPIQSYHAVQNDIGGAVRYLYGPAEDGCCCPDNAQATWRVQSENVAYQAPVGACLAAVDEQTGSGPAGFLVHQVIRQRVPPGCSGVMSVVVDRMLTTSTSACGGSSGVGLTVQTIGGITVGTIGQSNTRGWRRVGCDVDEGQVYVYVDTGTPGSHQWHLIQTITWSIVRSVDRSPCQTSECILCCLPDATCVTTTAASCADKHGVVVDDCTICETRHTGACCQPDGSCARVSRIQCEALSGIYLGDETDCASANCPVPVWACCLGTTCNEMPVIQCLASGGTPYPNQRCTPTLCTPVIGRCCYTGPNGEAICDDQHDANFCLNNGGTWMGGGQTCANQPCNGPCCRPLPGGSCTPTCEENFSPATCAAQFIPGCPPPVFMGYGNCCQGPACPNGVTCIPPGQRPAQATGSRGFFLDGLSILHQRASRRRPDQAVPGAGLPLLPVVRARYARAVARHRRAVPDQRQARRTPRYLLRPVLPQRKAPGRRDGALAVYPLDGSAPALALVLHVHRPGSRLRVHLPTETTLAADQAAPVPVR